MSVDKSTPSTPLPVSANSVKRYLITKGDVLFERWIVVGKERDYIVSDAFCSCSAFARDLFKDRICKHVRYFLESKDSGEYDEFTIDYSEFLSLREEWLRFSPL